jgi:hypothetical protein
MERERVRCDSTEFKQWEVLEVKSMAAGDCMMMSQSHHLRIGAETNH